MFWIIFCDITYNIYHSYLCFKLNGWFVDYLEDKSNQEIAIMILYFSFTSLSTVGFGDIRPESDLERFFGAIVLLLGVSVFSMIMNNFKEIIDKFNSLNADLADEDNLNKFFGLL